MKTTRREFFNTTALATGATALSGQRVWGYSPAETADGGLSWPDARALPQFAQPVHLDVAHISGLTGDEQALLVTLQGIVNRTLPRLYWLPSTDPSDQAWLDTIGVPYTVASNPWSLFSKYRHEITGAIVYDKTLPDTINVATSLAGIRNAVIATPALASGLRLPVLQDLGNLFINKIAAYNWLVTNYWSQLNHRTVAAIAPINSVAASDVYWATLLRVADHVHDASNKQTYTMDLSGFLRRPSVYVRFQDAFPSEGWGPSVGQVTVLADDRPIASFQPGSYGEKAFLYDADGSSLASAWRFADGNSSFIYVFTPPAGARRLTLQVLMWNQYLVTATNTAPLLRVANPEFRDYIAATRSLVFWLDHLVRIEAFYFNLFLQKFPKDSLYTGWFPNGNETQGVTLCAQHAVSVAATDFFDNASVFGGASAQIATTQPAATVPELENKIYVTLTMSEGDNLQYDQHRMRAIWDDPNRGQTPLNWSIDPLLIDAAPSMLAYYQRTQTANDFLVAGPSGAGYTYPGDWPPESLTSFTERSGRYMRACGLNVIYALNRRNNTDLPLADEVAVSYARYIDPLGILYNWESTSQLSTPAGMPVFTQIGIGSIADGQTALQNALQSWNGNAPLFVALGVLAWNLQPTDVNGLVRSLGAQFSVVRADVFFRLIRRSLQPS